MASKNQHTLERRSALLAEKMRGRINDLKQSLTAPQGRILYRTKMSQSDALNWWAQHRYDQYGQKALAGLDPQSIFQLDAALAQHVNSQEEQGMPQENLPPAAMQEVFGGGQ